MLARTNFDNLIDWAVQGEVIFMMPQSCLVYVRLLHLVEKSSYPESGSRSSEDFGIGALSKITCLGVLEQVALIKVCKVKEVLLSEHSERLKLSANPCA